MSKDLKSMTDSELRKHIVALERKVYRPLWSPVYKWPDGWDEARREESRRQELVEAKHTAELAKLREKECEANKNAELHNLMIRGITPAAAHELNNEREK